MSQTKIRLPIKNFDKQEEIFSDDTPFKIVKKGRRFGFTKGAANNTIKKSLKGEFTKGLWVDVVNSNIDRYVERYFLPVLKLLPQNYWKWQQQQKILHIRDTYIDFRSADNPETLEGFGYDYVILNEAGIILKNEYLWHNAIVPMLWDFKKCEVIIGGAPKGKGLFEQLYLRGLDPDQPNYKSFSYTSFDNPYSNHQLILDEMKRMPERVVRQEIYAEFLDDTGVVFRGVKDIAILKHIEEVPKDRLYVIGCDLAKVQDYTVLAVYDRLTNEQVYQMRFNKLDWPYQKEKIKDLSIKFNNALVIADATGIGDPIVDDLLRAGVPVEPIHLTNEQKKQIIEKLASWVELKNIKMLNLEETINEFTSFTYDITSTGKVRYEAPVGFHDDIVIAHALAIWSLQPVIVREDDSHLSIIARDVRDKIQEGGKTEEDLFWEVESV